MKTAATLGLSPTPHQTVRRAEPTNPFVEFGQSAVDQSIPDRFEEQVRHDPRQIAVKTVRHELTYDALNRAANRVAHAILSCRGWVQEPVAFLLESGAAQIVAILGVLKAGKIYVPLEASFPKARTIAELNDSQAGLLLSDSVHYGDAEALSQGICSAVNLDAIVADASEQDLNLSLSPDQPAFILYTSGSTGQPKGVVQSHRNVLYFTRVYTNSLHLSREDRLAQTASFSFSASVADIFRALLNGATLLPFDMRTQGLANLAPWLMREEVTVFHSVPTVFRRMVATLTGAEEFPRLRLIRLAGEAVFQKDAELYRAHFSPKCLLANTLAATETNAIRQFILDQDMPLNGNRVPVGYPMGDADVVLLDDAGNEVEACQTGEIAIRSRYLALGYWRNPELTRQAFRPDPERPGFRIFRTGDLGLLHPDGCLEHLGRKDFQVKVRGHRVELGEVETALLDIEGVRETVVVGREDESSGQRLVAYVVPAAGPAPTVTALRQALRRQLPDYMIPAAFVFLDALPTTTSAKVDRRALPAPDNARPVLDTPYMRPLDPIEALLADVWEDCLRVRPVGARDNFFELGGDSIQAMEMLAKVEQRLGTKLGPESLMGGATIEHLARAVLESEGGRAQPPIVEVQAGTSGRRFFFLHGNWYGGGLFCINLARHLGSDQPFCAIHPHGVTGLVIPQTIEEMAADNLRDLLAFQPDGPYLLGGYCNGGLIAFEMADQLCRQGKQVDLLVVVAPPPESVVSLPCGAGAGRENNLITTRSGRFARLDLSQLKQDERIAALGDIYRRACQRYVMRPYPGRLVVFRPRDDEIFYGPLTKWPTAAKEIEIHRVPGGHHTALTKHVEELASALRAELDKAIPT